MKYYDLAKNKPVRGSNGYETKYVIKFKKRQRGQWKFWLAGYGIFLCCVFLSRAIFSSYSSQAHAQVISPLPTPIKTPLITQYVTATPTPKPTDTPIPTPTEYQYDAAAAIKRIWGKDYKIGLAISSCESGTNPNKYHINDDGSIDFSVFQINTIHGIILDPEENIRYAYKLFLEQGTHPWYSSEHCWRNKI